MGIGKERIGKWVAQQRTRYTSKEVEWKVDPETNEYAAFVDDKRIGWAPLPGSQSAYLKCPVQEVLFHGTRGPGKTQGLLADFCQHVGHGWGMSWQGIIFRRTFPELKDLEKKALEMIPNIFPGAKYNRGEHIWTFEQGEQLRFSFLLKDEDYLKYHGHEYPFLGFEELTNWPDDSLYLKMFSTNRSTKPGMPKKIRATTNPYGPGHNWVKNRFRIKDDQVLVRGEVIQIPGEPVRTSIKGHLLENKCLMHADPDYVKNLNVAAENEAQRRAWLHGHWEVTAGGMFDDIWERHIHVVPYVDPRDLPIGWKITRSYDHGQSRPFSVGWWAESNGQPYTAMWMDEHQTLHKRTFGEVRGDLIRIHEWYGWNGEPNKGIRLSATEIARGILERERANYIREPKWGVADASIFDKDAASPDVTVAGRMKKEGVKWKGADKSPGSRAQGWQIMRELMKGSVPPADGSPRTAPGIFVMDHCTHFLRTVPSLARDRKKLDDVDTDAEDHVADEVRYRCRGKFRRTVKVSNDG